MARPTIHSAESFKAAADALGEAPLTLALLDIDHFALLNEQLGRTEGDRVLKVLERLLSSQLPSGSVLGRVGGDEYAVLLPETAPETALLLFDDIIKHFYVHRDPQWPRSLGLSVGLAARPAHARRYTDLRRAAAEALWRAKREGRGRVCLYTESKMVLKASYYPRSQLERLSKLAAALGQTEASLLRGALEGLLEAHREEL